MTVYAWLNAQWQAIPPPTRAMLVSFALSTSTAFSGVVGAGYALGPGTAANPLGGFNDWPTFVTFMGHAWFGIIFALIFQVGPYARFFVTRAQQTPPAP